MGEHNNPYLDATTRKDQEMNIGVDKQVFHAFDDVVWKKIDAATIGPIRAMVSNEVEQKVRLRTREFLIELGEKIGFIDD